MNIERSPHLTGVRCAGKRRGATARLRTPRRTGRPWPARTGGRSPRRRRCREGVGRGQLVGEGVHRAAVDVQLPVDPAGPHLLLEGPPLSALHHRIVGPDQGQHLARDVAGVLGVHGGEARMEADDRLEVGSAAGQFQRQGAAEAEADGGQTRRVGARLGRNLSRPAVPTAKARAGSDRNSPIRPIICSRSVIGWPRRGSPRRRPRTRARRRCGRPGPSVIVQTGPLMADQHPGAQVVAAVVGRARVPIMVRPSAS